MIKISRESEVNLINDLIDQDVISGKDLPNIKKLSLEAEKSQLEAVFDLKFILILFGLSIAGTALAYIVYFRILELAGAANLMLVTIIVPVFAILIDVILLQKWISLQIFLGFIVISFGLLLIDGRLLWAILKKLKSK